MASTARTNAYFEGKHGEKLPWWTPCLPAELVHPHHRTAASVPGGAGTKGNVWATSKDRVSGMR